MPDTLLDFKEGTLSKTKLFISLFLLMVLSSCSTLLVHDAKLFVEVPHNNVPLLKNNLWSSLSTIYLCSEEPATDEYDVYLLTCESNPYDSEAKGIFGFGPMWEEKIAISIRVIQAEGQPLWAKITTTVFEKQKGRAEWRNKDDSSFDPAIEAELIRKVQFTIKDQA